MKPVCQFPLGWLTQTCCSTYKKMKAIAIERVAEWVKAIFEEYGDLWSYNILIYIHLDDVVISQFYNINFLCFDENKMKKLKNDRAIHFIPHKRYTYKKGRHILSGDKQMTNNLHMKLGWFPKPSFLVYDFFYSYLKIFLTFGRKWPIYPICSMRPGDTV